MLTPLTRCSCSSTILRFKRTKLALSTFTTSQHDTKTDSQAEFIESYSKNHIKLSTFQRGLLTLGSAAISITNPYRGDMIACLGETTGEGALIYCRELMKKSDEGRRLLEDKPRIDTGTLDLDCLEALPDGTVGRTYANFLRVNKVSPDDRPPVKFVDDLELAYVMQRYREVHDIFHAILLMPTTMLGEVTVKWVEGLQLKLPMCVAGAIFGAARLKPKQRQLYLNYHMPWAIKTGKNANFLLSVYFEERWEQSLDDFHREMNIERLV